MDRLKANIKLCYLFRFLRDFMLFLPVWALFFLENGLNMAQVLILSTSMHISQQAFEVPSGIFADVYGRKKAITISAGLYLISVFTLSNAYSFLGFFIGLLILGASYSFSSGSIVALVYDSLYGREKEFMNIEGHSFFFAGIATGIASIIGGLIAVKSFRLTFVFTLIPASLLIIVSFLFFEPEHHKKIGNRNFLAHYKEAYRYTLKHKKIGRLISYFGLNMAFLYIFFSFLQPYLKSFNIQNSTLGYLYAFFWIMSGVASKLAALIEARIGERKSLLLNPLLIIIGLLILLSALSTKSLIFAIAGALMFDIVWGFINPVISAYINHHIESKHRATINSFKGFIFGICMLLFAPILGYIKDAYTFSHAFAVMIVLAVFSLIFTLNGDKDYRDAE